MMRWLFALVVLLATPATAKTPPVWARNANVYEVNVRQFSRDGTFVAVEAQLPRLKRMGVKILWFMPIQPIGEKNRKGALGSYYAIKDYTAINPEFGTMADFKRLVRAAHAQGMKVIIDWVANHTAWDHPWVAQHPGWFKTDETGKIVSVRFGAPPNLEEWTDVVALDYTKPGVADAMIAAMTFWLRETGIDGFRCDVAGLVPEPFWARVRAELDRVKPVFMLAESDDAKLHARAFDMTYNWKPYQAFVKIAKGEASAADLRALYATPDPAFGPNDWRMVFTTNHDENSWHGSDAEFYGPRFRAFATLAATLPGMPLIYNGQESGLAKRLQFFEKDPIDWSSYANADFYQHLLALKRDNRALWMGTAGGSMTVLDAGHPDLFAFERRKGANRVWVVANLSDKPRRALIDGRALSLGPWEAQTSGR